MAGIPFDVAPQNAGWRYNAVRASESLNEHRKAAVPAMQKPLIREPAALLSN
jgi:hypothetical protein